MTDEHIVEAYGVKFTTDAWAAFTWRQHWTAFFILAGGACLLGALAAIGVSLLSLPANPTENLEEFAYAVGLLGFSVILSTVGAAFFHVGASFYPIPWRYSLSIEDQLEMEAQEVGEQ